MRIFTALALLCLCVFSFQVFAADMAPSVDTLSAQEKQVWETLKSGDMNAFGAMLADDILNIDASGVAYNKKQTIDMMSTMKMTDYALSDFSLFALDSDCVVLTYKAKGNGTMDKQTMSFNTLNTTTYVKAGGKWMPKAHTETPIQEMPAAK